jgi:hypothetical protein
LTVPAFALFFVVVFAALPTMLGANSFVIVFRHDSMYAGVRSNALLSCLVRLFDGSLSNTSDWHLSGEN